MTSKKQKAFCTQLTHWLHSSEWHFAILLTISIETVQNLPDNANTLIKGLLFEFPNKPSAATILNYLIQSKIIDAWFENINKQPQITSFNLSLNTPKEKTYPSQPTLTSIIDLADWLNITLDELEWLADLNRSDAYKANKLKHYHYNTIEKRHGGVRLIESPKSLLKEVQQKINSELLSVLPTHNAAHGFCPKKSITSHAKNHTQKRSLMIFDISNCFNSVQWRAVYSGLCNLNYTDELTKYLTALCTHQLNSNESVIIKLSSQQKQLVQQRHLPQGAPTSPALSNIVMYKLDKRLSGLAKKLDLSFSRYADDLAFSTNINRDWAFLEPLVGSICLEEGFTLNHRKSRTLLSHQRQKLTGVVVNEFPNIDRRYYDNLKATLNNCAKLGINSQNRENHEFFYEHLAGKINHVSSINHKKGEKLWAIFNTISFNKN